ncbi:MAG: D-glycero-beta-D-manno-heptose 1,7-bisphosphate 7-phosphatase [Candidatus Woesearchaeota archaeon]
MKSEAMKNGFLHLQDKLRPIREISSIASSLRKEEKKIVTLNGSFDLIHSGHIYLIQEARKQGDVLVIGLNSDRSYGQYKDERGPIMGEMHRAAIISAMQDVDYVVLFDETTPIKFIEAVKPHVHCNGAEYEEDCVEAQAVREVGGRLHLIREADEGGDKISTTGIMERIAERFGSGKRKAVFLDRDGILNADKGYVFRPEDFEFVEGSVDALKYLKSKGYILVIITGQSGIGRGKYSLDDMKRFNRHLMDMYGREGITFDRIYYCPHHPDEGCDCRKPGFQLWQKAKKELNIDMAKSWTIGDKLDDCKAGKKAGTRTILLESDYTSGDDKDRRYVDRTAKSMHEIKDMIKS